MQLILITKIAAYGLLLVPLAGAVATAGARSTSVLRLRGINAAALTWLCALVLLVLNCGTAVTANWDVITWIALGQDTVITAGFLIDPTSTITAFVVASTNLAVHICKSAFETEELHQLRRQDAVVHFGVSCALLAVIANNYGMLYAGWEGVALSTWLLVRLRGDGPAAARTLVFQGLASLGLLSALVFMLLHQGSVAFVEVLGGSASAIIGLSIALAGVARAGMWPLHPWLERSASLGTPAAAFIQVVFAVPLGLYLLVRSWQLISPEGLSGIGLAGAALMAACAAAARDPRRSLAYSTSSQGAIALTLVSMGMPAVALLQLSIHTCVKCVLLLTTGLAERASSAAFELTTLGGLRVHLKTAYGFALVATIVLVLPPFASFWVQLSILQAAAADSIPFAIVGGLVVLLTSVHLFRLLFGIFTGGNPSTVIREGSSAVPVAFMACLSGLAVMAMLISHQASPIRLAAAIPGTFADVGAMPSAVLVESMVAIACVLLTLAGCGWAWVLVGRLKPSVTSGAGRQPHLLRHVLGNGLLFDDLYTAIARSVCWLADSVLTIVDVAVELLCLRGIGAGVRVCGWLVGTLHDGRFSTAATAVVLSAAVTLVGVVWLTSR